MIRARAAATSAWVAALLATLLVCRARPVPQADHKDRVKSLPGINGHLPSRLFSGYLSPNDHDHVHYLLAESEGDPSEDPLVLWLNGGPGASSLMGALTELGPVVFGNQTITSNPFSWTRLANMLFLESPTGVGYSWCEAMKQGGTCNHTDTTTAELNLNSLMHFLEVHPQFKGRDFMMWGESYAGVYVPTLANLVYESDIELNFLGFGTGDPCTDDDTQTKPGDLGFTLDYAMAQGFVSAKLHKFLSTTCLTTDHTGLPVPDQSTEECKRGWRMFFVSTSGGEGMAPADALLPHGGFIDPYNSYGPNNGPWWMAMAKYLSEPAVMDALNIKDTPLTEWSLFAAHLEYTKEYHACFLDDNDNHAQPVYNSSMVEIYQKLAGKLRNIVVFNGDTDPCVQMRGTEAAVVKFGLKVEAGKEWRPWFYRPAEVDEDFLAQKTPYWGLMLGHRPLSAQLGGYVTDYEQGLSFVTVHTSGHMVPQYRPMAALHLFQMALLNKPLSPPLDMSAVSGDSDEAFYGTDDRMGYMGKWVALAQSSAYVGKDEMSSQDKTETH